MAKSEKNLTAVFTDTANAIRAKKESVELISPVDFADEIATIETGVNPEGTLEITNNGVYDVTLKASVNVEVSGEPPYDEIEIFNNGEVNVTDYKTAIVKVAPVGVNASFLKDILEDTSNISEDGNIFELEYDFLNFISISQTSRYSYHTYSSNLIGMRFINGGHEYGGKKIIVVDTIVDNILDEETYWNFELDITYTDFEGSQTAEELESEWHSYLQDGIKIYDLSGNCVGITNPSIYIHLEGGC